MIKRLVRGVWFVGAALLWTAAKLRFLSNWQTLRVSLTGLCSFALSSMGTGDLYKGNWKDVSSENNARLPKGLRPQPEFCSDAMMANLRNEVWRHREDRSSAENVWIWNVKIVLSSAKINSSWLDSQTSYVGVGWCYLLHLYFQRYETIIAFSNRVQQWWSLAMQHIQHMYIFIIWTNLPEN